MNSITRAWGFGALLSFFLLSSCVHRAPAAAPPPASAAGNPRAISEQQLQQIQEGQALREEGLRLFYAKDPRVKNPAKAFEKLLAAAKLGDPVAMDSVGGIYSSGLAGAEKSCAKAMEWFERSAASGYSLAANNLAYLYVTCDEKKRRDAGKAEAILKLMLTSNPSMIAVLDTYGATLAEQGDFKQAANTMQVVISLQELIESNPERIDQSKQALELYKKKQKLPAGFDARPELDDPR
jgi:TPR repeat protein